MSDREQRTPMPMMTREACAGHIAVIVCRAGVAGGAEASRVASVSGAERHIWRLPE